MFNTLKQFKQLSGIILSLGIGITTALATPLAAAPQISLNPTTHAHNFDQKVTTDPEPYEFDFEITNTGDQPLNFTGPGFTFTGPDASDFALTTTPLITPLTNGYPNNRTYTVTFAPSSEGVKTAQLLITTDDPANPTTTMTLTGTGIASRGTIYQGPYTGFGPGESTIGTGGDYPTLFAATRALYRHSLTGGNWNFLILNDLFEPNNSTIGLRNSSGYTVTFRPAPSTQAVITFTTTTANPAEMPGHIMIGAPEYKTYNYALALNDPVPTDRICIDGSNVPNGTTRSLTLQNAPGSFHTAIIGAMGDCDNISIKNCKINGYGHTSSQFFSTGSSGIECWNMGSYPFLPYQTIDNALIQNCEISAIGPDPSSAIVCNPSRGGYINGGMYGNLTVKNNDIQASESGIKIIYSANTTVSNNSVNMFSSSTSANLISGLSIPYTSKLSITGNTVHFESNTSSVKVLQGISCDISNDSIFIANNNISGLSAPATNTIEWFRFGIKFYSSGKSSILTVVQNSIDMPGTSPISSGYRQSAAVYMGSNPSSPIATRLIASNNIFSIRIPGGTAIYVDAPVNFVQSDYNNFDLAPGNKFGITNASNPTLDWQTYFGLDTHSTTLDPNIPLTPGAGTWYPPVNGEQPNLHFTSFPGTEYQVPTNPAVTTDIDNQPRGTNMTLVGADEIPPPPANINQWELY